MKFKQLLIAQLMAGVCLAAPVHAQAADDQESSDDSFQSGAIIVTAQRRSQSLQEIPLAVNAVGADDLTARGMADTRSLSMSVPSLTLSENGVSVTPFLRGVGSNQSNPNDEPSVATYVDGVYIASPTGNIFSFNNIERIEVLRGPQGTLFGRNATGGVIQIVTRDPEQDPELRASIGYGNFDTLDISAYATTGLGPDLAADVAVVYHNNFDGYGRDIFRNEDIFRREEFAVRSKFLWTPGATTEIRLSLDYSELHSTGTDYQLAEGVIGADGVTSYPGERLTNTDFANTGDNEIYGGSLRIDQDLDFARLVSITGYRHVTGEYHLDQDATPTPIVQAYINQLAESFSEELQLIAPEHASVDWLIGLYYFDANYAYTPLTIEGFGAAPFTSLDLVGSQDTRSYSAYGQVTVPVLDNTNFTAGLRFTHESQSTVGSVVGDGMVVVPDIPQEQSFDKLTWRVAIDHQFSPDILGYISYNRGIKSGGFNMINAGTPGYSPEILDAYEAGLKMEFMNGQIRINSAVFYYDYRDIQVFSVTGGGAVLTQNAASAELWGFDVDIYLRLSDYFTINGGLGYVHSEYTDFPNATFTPPSPLDGPQYIGDASGNQLIFAPDITFNIAANYRIPTEIGDINLNGAVSYRDDVYVSAQNRFQIPAYTLVNASIGWTSLDERYGVRLWVRNLFDETYYANRTEQALGDIQYLAPPRTYGVTFDVRL